MKDAWLRNVRYRSAIGIAKDGRPIYSPLHDNGKETDDCEVDICNGREINGHYAYVSSFFHPYFIGCYGPGNAPELAQSCSANPRACGNVVIVAGSNFIRYSAILLGYLIIFITI